MTVPPAPIPPPPGAFGPGPIRPTEPPRASWWSVAATFATLVLAGVLMVSLTDNRSEADDATRVVTTMLVGLAIGAAIANLTPIGRWFRRWSAIVVSMILWILGMIGFALIGAPEISQGGALVLLGGMCLVAGLDLCYVSRLRVAIVLSGLAMVIVVAAMESSALFSAFAWFAAALFALWLLSVDEQRSLDRPEPLDGRAAPPRGRGADLVRTLVMALLIGFTLAFLLSTPSCSFSPLARALEWLPWHPEIKPDWVPSTGQPVQLHEVDAEGREFTTYVDPSGRRFIVDPLDHQPYGVVDRDGATVVLDRRGRELGRFEDDGSLAVTDPGGETITYQRDAEGWFVDAPDGTRYRVQPDGTITHLVEPTGRPAGSTTFGVPDRFMLEPHAGDAGGLDRNGDGMIAAPHTAILDATTGTDRYGREVERVDGGVRIHGDDGEVRTHRRSDGSAEVDVEPRLGSEPDHRYRLNDDDQLTVYDENDSQVLQVDVDREGNALDALDELDGSGESSDLRDRQPETDSDRPSPPWKTIALVVAALAAIGAAIAFAVWWRRRHADEDTLDRDWAEQQVRRLEVWGRDHTFGREPAESIVRYAARLDREIARDGALPEVGDVLDDALFGHRPLPAEDRLRTEATIDRLLAAHPKPGRAERLRGGPDHDGDLEPAGGPAPR